MFQVGTQEKRRRKKIGKILKHALSSRPKETGKGPGRLAAVTARAADVTEKTSLETNQAQPSKENREGALPHSQSIWDRPASQRGQKLTVDSHTAAADDDDDGDGDDDEDYDDDDGDDDDDDRSEDEAQSGGNPRWLTGYQNPSANRLLLKPTLPMGVTTSYVIVVGAQGL
ncbi:hypothetical protein ElyMa_004469000 [Elysia marginata]|uniref:Uncharacterized protein n=1 Tax=Elysia marginata TaxID=1093978 RepID=A0AAV4HJ68_9GAST|nr:hypothetical protein ElyMa_004469000 [Elysia marginata]